MSVEFRAPHPMVQTIMCLPNPLFGDAESFTASVTVKRSINNTKYTYVKTKDGRKRLQMRFRMTRMKMLEVRAFIRAYYRTAVQFEDERGDRWIGWITTNPNEFENTRAIFGNTEYTGQSLAEIQIEFEGNKL